MTKKVKLVLKMPHGTSPSDFRELTARYFVDRKSTCFDVTTADHHGGRVSGRLEGE
jgi:hypothetical protein